GLLVQPWVHRLTIAVIGAGRKADRGPRRRSPSRSLLGAAGLPVLLRPRVTGLKAEAAQLGTRTQAPLELGEAGKGGQRGDVVPQPDRFLRAGQPADHRPEEGGATGRAELDDRRPDVAAGQCQRLL